MWFIFGPTFTVLTDANRAREEPPGVHSSRIVGWLESGISSRLFPRSLLRQHTRAGADGFQTSDCDHNHSSWNTMKRRGTWVLMQTEHQYNYHLRMSDRKGLLLRNHGIKFSASAKPTANTTLLACSSAWPWLLAKRHATAAVALCDPVRREQ